MAKSAISPSNVHPFPAMKPGFRLVPARVARKGQEGVIVYVECPNWCVEDHVVESVGNVEDVMHRSVDAELNVPTFGYGAYPIQMHAWVESDPVAADPQFRAAHVTITDAGGNTYCHLTPDQTEKVADEIIGFASEMRHQARTARLANQTSGAEQAAEGGVA